MAHDSPPLGPQGKTKLGTLSLPNGKKWRLLPLLPFLLALPCGQLLTASYLQNLEVLTLIRIYVPYLAGAGGGGGAYALGSPKNSVLGARGGRLLGSGSLAVIHFGERGAGLPFCRPTPVSMRGFHGAHLLL